MESNLRRLVASAADGEKASAERRVAAAVARVLGVAALPEFTFNWGTATHPDAEGYFEAQWERFAGDVLAQVTPGHRRRPSKRVDIRSPTDVRLKPLNSK